MGVRRKKPSREELFDSLTKILIPPEILKDFDVINSEEFQDYWKIELREKEDRIPELLKEYKDVVLDGYCNVLELQSYAHAMKPIYLGLYRRRWKRSSQSKHYSNSYQLSVPHTKIVKELGVFFKTKN